MRRMLLAAVLLLGLTVPARPAEIGPITITYDTGFFLAIFVNPDTNTIRGTAFFGGSSPSVEPIAGAISYAAGYWWYGMGFPANFTADVVINQFDGTALAYLNTLTLSSPLGGTLAIGRTLRWSVSGARDAPDPDGFKGEPDQAEIKRALGVP